MVSCWKSGHSAHVSPVLISLWIRNTLTRFSLHLHSLLLLLLGWYAHFGWNYVHLWGTESFLSGTLAGYFIVFTLMDNCLNRWTWYLQASANCSQGQARPQLSSQYIGWFILTFKWCYTKKQFVSDVPSKYIHRCVFNSNVINQSIRSF